MFYRQSPYVLDVVDGRVKFTEEFKDLACREFMQNQKTMREIFLK